MGRTPFIIPKAQLEVPTSLPDGEEEFICDCFTVNKKYYTVNRNGVVTPELNIEGLNQEDIIPDSSNHQLSREQNGDIKSECTICKHFRKYPSE